MKKLALLFVGFGLFACSNDQKTEEEKKTKVSVALEPELLTYYRNLHINLSSLVNKLLKDYRENGNKDL
jgi:hypothetical protein